MDSAENLNTGTDSDGSVSWEDFFGASTDLVPQLLGMFDELARKTDCNNHYHNHNHHHGEHIPAAIQKRLSLVAHSQRNSIFGHICANSQQQQQQQQSQSQSQHLKQVEQMQEQRVEYRDNKSRVGSAGASQVEITVSNHVSTDDAAVIDNQNESNNSKGALNANDVDKQLFRREITDGSGGGRGGLMPEYGSRRRKHLGRPLSGSSIASSTSSSGCSNQGNACSANPYLASVESLADTCASSQGSADSGVVTTSEVNCREVISVNNNNNTSTNNNNNNNNNSNNNSRRISRSIEDSPLLYHRARYCDPKRNPVERVLLEIVDTEAIYVEHLRQVIQGYLIFWRDDPASLLQHLELNHLFSNIEDIFSFNSEFLKEIEACGLDPVGVANTFTKHNSGFKVYTEYCTNYPRTVSVLTDLMSRDDTAKAFRERQAALGHALPLGSFLLKPVQRILKYHLLLENLSKEYEADEKRKSKDLLTKDNRNIIEEALATMTGIAKHINAMKRRHEHAVRVQEIQSLLYGWPGPDLTTSGELIAEGRFRMRGAKAPRHAFLFERMLLLTKKKEDGLLVYKAHIMCSNLMLIESIPGEPCSFHVIPFDNPRLQYTLQARNLEQKREWTLQIKRVMLENYNAVIPIHARQLVLQLGQSQQDDENNSVNDRGSAKKLYSAPPEYLERRKLEKERRRSEAGIRQKIKKTITNNKTLDLSTPDSPAPSRKLNDDQNINNRDRSLNRSLDGRASKVKDRFTNWRRKSEPGFQSYISLNQSDEEKNENRITQNNDSTAQTEPALSPAEITNSANIIYENTHNLSGKNSPTANTKEKDINEQQQQQPQEQEQEQKTKVRTVEEIVGHILMQNQEFQRLLEKQRNNSLANVRHQRFKKNQRSVDTSDDSDNGELNYSSDFNNINSSNNSRVRPTRIIRREHRLVRSNNAWNSLSSQGVRDNQPSLQLQYNNLHIDDNKNQSKMNRVQEKRAVFEAFKRQSIVTESKIIKTALRMRENSPDKDNKVQDKNIINDSKDTVSPTKDIDDCNYAWDEFKNERCSKTSADSPTRPAVWLTKLCQDLPTSPQKSGSLPRSFQINQTDPSKATAEIKQISKARFLQRDGKPMSERPFTIASDKPGEINLDDMEQRYTTASYETDNKINNKFKNSISACSASTSASSSTFFYSVDDNLTDGDSDIHTIATSTSTNIHPDHKIYRANNISGSTMLKNVLSKAGSRLQGLRSTVSAETLECTDDFDKSKRFPSCKIKKKKKFNNKLRLSRESSTDVDEPVIGCVPGGNSSLDLTHLYYKQGSSGLGARIAQADYADPSVLFFDIKRGGESNISDNISVDNSNVNLIGKIDDVNNDEDDNDNDDDDYYEEDDDDDGDDDDRRQRLASDGDNYYEKCFESIENYIDETDDAFRDSAIFSDGDEVVSPLIKSKLITRTTPTTSSVVTSDDKNINDNNNKSSDNNFLKKPKIAPPVPVKRKINLNDKKLICENDNLKPNVALKPDNLKLRTRLIVGSNSRSSNSTECVKITVTKETIPIPISLPSYLTSKSDFNCTNNGNGDDGNKNNDVSAGQSQAGWVKKMVGQLQAQIETL